MEHIYLFYSVKLVTQYVLHVKVLQQTVLYVVMVCIYNYKNVLLNVQLVINLQQHVIVYIVVINVVQD
jgi:hypothetical protein